MTMKVLVLNDATGVCELQKIVAYPSVVSTDASVTITAGVDANGKTVFDLKSEHVVDVNIDNIGFSADGSKIVITETQDADGNAEVHEIDITDLLKSYEVNSVLVDGNLIAKFKDLATGNEVEIKETVTSLEAIAGGFKYTNESSDEVSVTVCDMLAGVPDNGNTFGA